MRRSISFFTLLGFLVLACGQSNKKVESASESEKKEIEKLPAKDNFMTRMEKEALGRPFKGVFTSTGKENNLFPIRATGVSTEPMKIACGRFMNSLSKEQLKKSNFPIDDQEWFKWSNVDNGLYPRQGISIKEMTQDQRVFAYTLLKESLSAKGLQLSKDIMKTDQTLRELNDGNNIYDEELYYFTIMGTPSETEPWGWQLDGHHLIINYFVLGDQVVMSPVFMGGEPIVTTSGKYKGNTLFQDEQNQGLHFMQSLPDELQKEATLNPEKAENNISAEAFGDNAVVNYEGLQVSKLSSQQKRELLALVNQYISNMSEGHAKIKMEDVEKHLNSTWFSWIGSTDEDAVFYYRIHSPVVLIEFDHQGPIGVKASRGSGATRNHIHTIVRTPNGNDYGKDLLRQHLEKHH